MEWQAVNSNSELFKVQCGNTTDFHPVYIAITCSPQANYILKSFQRVDALTLSIIKDICKYLGLATHVFRWLRTVLHSVLETMRAPTRFENELAVNQDQKPALRVVQEVIEEYEYHCSF